MSTIVWFHAHPDDEAILTGGSMVLAAEAGHRNVLVVATDGAHGEVPDDLRPGETLVDRRRAETEASAAVLGIDRIVWLGYADSGMQGWPQNDLPGAFLRADPDEATARLASVITEEAADVLVTYDWHGGYGHPDHIGVHRIGHLAAGRTGIGRLFEATMNRDRLRAMMEAAKELRWDPDAETVDLDTTDDGTPFGTPEAELTHEVDVSRVALRKREAVSCHASQVTDTSFFRRLDDELFVLAFGHEWFTRVGMPFGMQSRWLLDD